MKKVILPLATLLLTVLAVQAHAAPTFFNADADADSDLTQDSTLSSQDQYGVSDLINNNQISLGLGGTVMSRHGDGDAGLSYGIGYAHFFTPQIGAYVGINGGDTFTDTIMEHMIAPYLINDVETWDYYSVPIAAQFKLPLGNNEFFVRAGANYYSLDKDVAHQDKDGKTISEDHDTYHGFGPYGAIGWQYNFGFDEARNWLVGIDCQYMRIKQYNTYQTQLNIGYRF